METISLTVREYARIIEIARKGFNERAICDYFLKYMPQMFLKAYDAANAKALPVKVLSHGIKEIYRLMCEGKKVAAIKEVRGLAGCGLKEAKDAVEIHLRYNEVSEGHRSMADFVRDAERCMETAKHVYTLVPAESEEDFVSDHAADLATYFDKDGGDW